MNNNIYTYIIAPTSSRWVVMINIIIILGRSTMGHKTHIYLYFIVYYLCLRFHEDQQKKHINTLNLDQIKRDKRKHLNIFLILSFLQA